MKGNAFTSHKYTGKSALCYKLGIDILARSLVWIHGPYPAGKGKYTNTNTSSNVLGEYSSQSPGALS